MTKLTKEQTRNKECLNALMGAYSGFHKLIDLRGSIQKSPCFMSSDKKLNDSISEVIDIQHELITRLEKVL
jgi:hypothetical protein